MSERDPLLETLRALPRAEPSPAHAEAVRRRAAALVEAPIRRPRLLPTLLVTGAVLSYFGWTVLFLAAPYLR